MIAYLKGNVMDVSQEDVIIDVNNIGYRVKISTQTAELLPKRQEEIIIYTYTHVREDAFLLYGFLTKEELEMFKLLITVNGIGPKGGLAILSAMTTDDIRLAIISGDAKRISKAPGVGTKTAERIILDLKDKVSLDDYLTLGENGTEPTKATSNLSVTNTLKDTVEALVALGYNASDAMKSVRTISDIDNITVEDALKLALKNMLH